VGRQFWLIESVTSPPGAIEPPTDPGAVDAPLPDFNVLVITAKVGLHQRMRGHCHHVLDAAPRPHNLQHSSKEFSPTTDLTNAPVGDQQRQFDTAAVTLNTPGEHRLKMGCQRGDLWADNRDLVWCQVWVFPKRMQDGVIENLRLPTEVMTAMDSD
jgi:hypothetical protein